MTLRITPARKELLQAIADGRVTEVYNMGTGFTADLDRGPEWVSRPGSRRYITVTSRVRELYVAGLIFAEQAERSYDPRPWRLTIAGKAALEAAGGAS